ncbi:SDR family NAD(P)-dependent oxidoreductase [Mycolicibacterium sp. 120270]|uniref:SDR family NAD(P)-dependent oxidoreductase n=1 Tax=Mycolicibacterium sp. 120270 TaxID=3090600 RepID=UPI00299DEBE0|nr:SDR family NAD(P)-dependent oxidoreductase [Mycolicibacterium sp. 120270]MDX1885576.1 SDR family NAD(P)-dependent oxidoreductase [Mycolicibacterium sp. 120270]
MTKRATAADVVNGSDLSGKVCVITGATSGLGRESARTLASVGAHVVLAARSPDGLRETEHWVRDSVDDAHVTAVGVDLTSLASVREAAAAIADSVPAVHILMNNAGVMFTPFGRTADGFEMQFGTNHLGHFELTRLLTPLLEAAGAARVINLSSDGHKLADLDFDDPNWHAREYNKFHAYGASKTANILHAVELDGRLRDSGVRAFAVHPGMVATNLARHMSREDLAALAALPRQRDISKETDVRKMEVLTPEQGAATQVWAAVSSELDDVGGVYLADCAIRPDVVRYATDTDRADRLEALSATLCAR